MGSRSESLGHFIYASHFSPSSSSKPFLETSSCYFPYPLLSYPHPSKSGVIKLFPKEPDSKYFRLCRPCSLQSWPLNTRLSLVLKTSAGLLVQSDCVIWFLSKSFKQFIFYLFFPHHMSCRIFIPQPGIKTVSLAVEAQSINHRTDREVLSLFILKNSS